jgi:tetratricopeptide (TPR) repeat protein
MKLFSKLIFLVIATSAISLVASDVSAQMARMSGVVVDADGQPIADATLTVTTPDSESFEMVKTTNKKGKVTLAFGNVEWRYQLRIEKDGYQARTEILQLMIGGTMKAEWVLVPADAAADAGEGGAGEGGGGGRAVRTYNEGVEAQRLGDLELAAEKYAAAAEMDPDLAAPHAALAAVGILTEDYETAAAEAEAALAIDPTDVRAMQLRFDAYRLGGNKEKADEAAKVLRDLGNLDEAAGRIFNEGVDAYTAGDTATAISKFEQVVQLDPEMTNAYVALGQMYLSQGAPAEAGAMLEQALQREPDNIRALKLGYDSARLTNDMETGAKRLERLAELDPQWMTTILFDHAGKLFNENKAAEAAFELKYVLEADPDLARAHFMYGMALYNSGQVKEGSVHLQKFIELAPDDPDTEIARGLMSYQQ